MLLLATNVNACSGACHASETMHGSAHVALATATRSARSQLRAIMLFVLSCGIPEIGGNETL